MRGDVESVDGFITMTLFFSYGKIKGIEWSGVEWSGVKEGKSWAMLL
ncbi:hypothetical protein [Paenibacillus taichungensis]